MNQTPLLTGRRVRIALLLLVLAFVATDAYLTRLRTTSWENPLRATIYPIAGDAQPATRDYLSALQREDLIPIEQFLQREAPRYGVAIAAPLRVRLGPVLSERPPLPPDDRGLLATAWWSLKLRWWANRREADQPRPRSQIRLFVLYYDPKTTPVVAHSLGMQKGLVGIVHAFATRHMTATNNVVIAHELLHTLGASDKYDPGTRLPQFPEGYADPQRDPRHPQDAAEIMGGRVAVAADRAEIPATLDEVVVGPATAREIGWTRGPSP